MSKLDQLKKELKTYKADERKNKNSIEQTLIAKLEKQLADANSKIEK